MGLNSLLDIPHLDDESFNLLQENRLTYLCGNYSFSPNQIRNLHLMKINNRLFSFKIPYISREEEFSITFHYKNGPVSHFKDFETTKRFNNFKTEPSHATITVKNPTININQIESVLTSDFILFILGLQLKVNKNNTLHQICSDTLAIIENLDYSSELIEDLKNSLKSFQKEKNFKYLINIIDKYNSYRNNFFDEN